MAKTDRMAHAQALMAHDAQFTGVVLAVALGFGSAVSPALKSASMDPQTAITQGEVN